MATSKRDVELALSITTAGENKLGELAGDVRDLATEGQKVAPSMQALAAALAAAAQETDKLRQAETQARSALKDGQHELQSQKDALTALRLETDATGKKTDEYKAKVTATKLAIFEAEKQVRALRTEQQQSSAAASQAAQAQTRLEQSLTKQREAATGSADALKGLGEQFAQVRALAVAAGGVLGGQLLGGAVGDLARIADQYANLSARIKLVTGDGAAFQEGLHGVQDVAQRTNTTLDATASLFGRIATAGKTLGVTTADALRLTETINQAIQVGGASAEASDAAITQLTQALQSGVLRGDEFNSVMEQAPRLAQALADGLGVTTGELRKMAEAGRLTSTTVIQALQGQAAAVQSEFQQLPATVGRALTNLSSAWTVYVGEVDKANGVSTKVAGAINLVASNLDTLAGVLLGVGKAALAYKAINLAETLISQTAATAAHTATVVANTAAVRANATATVEASAAATAGTGRFAAALGSIKLGALALVVTNMKDIGTAIGEGIAKWAGYGKMIENAEAAQRGEAAAAREAAAAKAALAQKLQLAADKALGLTTESKKLVDGFLGMRQQGESAAEALEKLQKALRIDDLKGLSDAGAALDALALRGELSAEQVRVSWERALKGVDLGIFSTEARAAFDNSEQGARRLAAAMDGALREAIRRAGLDFDLISGGMGAAATSAINDVDVIIGGLGQLEKAGADTSRVLAASLSKAIGNADSQKAIDSVRAQIEALRQKLGDKVADGFLDEAKQKATELKDAAEKGVPAIQSVREAMKQLGIQAPEDLANVAKANRDAWEKIKSDGSLGADVLAKAFERYAQSAMDAAGSSGRAATQATLQAEAAAKGLQIAFDNAGRVIVKSALDGSAALKQLKLDTEETTEALKRNAEAIDEINNRNKVGNDRITSTDPTKTVDGFKKNADGSASGTFENTLPIDLATQLQQTGGKGMSADDITTAITQATNAYQDMQALLKLNPGAASTAYIQSVSALMNAANSAKALVNESTLKGSSSKSSTSTPTSSSTASTTHTVNITLGGQTATVNTASAADSSTLVALLQQLQNASASAS